MVQNFKIAGNTVNTAKRTHRLLSYITLAKKYVPPNSRSWQEEANKKISQSHFLH